MNFKRKYLFAYVLALSILLTVASQIWALGSEQAKGRLGDCELTLASPKFSLSSAFNIVTAKKIIFETGIGAMPILSEGDRLQIQNILSQKPLVSAHFDEVFEIYLSARLRNFSEVDRAEIRAKVITITYDGDSFSANVGKVNFPRQFQKTILPIVVKAHEVEHIIQMHISGMDRDDKKSLAKTVALLFDARTVYWDEYGAMLAEWEILSACPSELVEQSLNVANGTLYFKKDEKKVETFQRVLRNILALPSREQYVALEHEAGRYSVRVVVLDAASYSTVLGMLGYLGYVSAHLIFHF